jgi:hypothetical protein
MPTMSNATKEVFDYLKLEVLTLHVIWLRIFRPLFASEENAKLFYHATPNTFGVFQGALLDNVCLALTRLADPPQSMNKDNMCLAQLINTLDPNADQDLIKTLETQLECFKQKCQLFRDRRNRWTAHRDLKTVQDMTIDPPPSFSRADVEAALKELRVFMDEVQMYFENAATAYEHTSMPDDGETLINLLKKGMEAQNQETARFLKSLDDAS